MSLYWIVAGVVLAVLVVLVARASGGKPAIVEPPKSLPSAGDVGADILELVRQGRKIEAIKLYRERYGVGLREAKEAVEAIQRHHGLD